VFQKIATINHATDSSKKCFNCGLRNFANKTECKRCKTNLSLPLSVAKNDKQTVANSGELGQSTFSFAWVLAALVVVLLGLVLFYMRQGPQGTPEAGGEAVAAQTPITPDAEPPAQNAAEQNSQSEAAATQVVADLKRFQDATERGIAYDEYDKQLNSLKTDLNTTLPSFVRHDPSDEIFRQEVAAALREYTAAGNWWKTTIANSSVFTENERTERTQRNWASARTHLTNAEKTLVR
jgi:predicted  nucleic acid-binding Zn-ribbon protein